MPVAVRVRRGRRLRSRKPPAAARNAVADTNANANADTYAEANGRGGPNELAELSRDTNRQL